MSHSRYINTFIVISLLSVCLDTQAEEPPTQTEEDKKVYRKFHPDGVVEFSDQPSKGSEELKVEELPTYEFTSPPKLNLRPVQPTRPTATPGQPYTALTITQPGRNEAIRANSGDIDIRFNLQPGLRTHLGHRIEYLLDGKSVLKSDRAETLMNIDRGTHTLVIQVIDQHGKVLINSDSVTFHVMRYFPRP